MTDHPSGTVTFLFTDIEGSMKLAQAHPGDWEAARQRHHAILSAACEAHHGYVFQVVGDAFCIAFSTAPEALSTALEAQHSLQSENWGQTPIRVRMGAHTGTAETHNGDYHGYLTLAHVQRVMPTAHGGQMLVSSATAGLLAGQLPSGTTLRDMGEHRLKGLLNPEHLWQVIAPDLPHDFPPLQTLNAIPNNLPLQPTSFVGREREIAEVKQLLSTTNLLTLTGSGGTGKTRLSLQIAAEVLDQFKDGAWFVELAALSDPALVPLTIAYVLGVREEPVRPLMATLLEWLRPKQLLLILDNCEHLVEACALFADAVLHGSRQTRILASSREALGIAGELGWHVPSLATPGPNQTVTAVQLGQYAAVRLFLDRARFALPAFSVTNANAPAVAQICYRLDGIPLAIELAAARIRVFSAEQIAARLDDRFRLLTGGSRTALPRQQTLRSAIDWSFSLLSEPERILFRRLSVFEGGWAFDAAETVCAGTDIEDADVLDLLTHLVEKSLVAADEQRGESRYRMLETIRQFAHDKLRESGESEALRKRHLEFFVQLAGQFDIHYFGQNQLTWLNRLKQEHDNVRVAVEWSLKTGDIRSAMRLVTPLFYLWVLHYPVEGLAYIHQIRLRPEAAGEPVAYADLLCTEGNIRFFQEDLAGARQPLEEAITLAKKVGNNPALLDALNVLGRLALAQRDYESARSYLMEDLQRAREEGNAFYMGDALQALGDVALGSDNLAEAQRLNEEAIAIFAPIGDRVVMGISQRRLGQMALRQGDYASASTYIRASVVVSTRIRAASVVWLRAWQPGRT